jgi:diguanylate cyclase (GGDEF)-like protein
VTFGVLLIEDNLGDARMFEEILADSTVARFVVTRVDRLAEAANRLAEARFDVVVLDLNLPDSRGLDTLRRAHTLAPGLPILILTGTDDDAYGLAALRAGAQDYVVKGRYAPDRLAVTLRFAIERHRLLQAARAETLLDSLTGLYNRRGFLDVAERQLRHAERAGVPALLLFLDVDGFKAINDNLGHAHGDLALTEVADALRRTFRGTDVLARLAGDEFAVLSTGAGPAIAGPLVTRLAATLDQARERRRYPLTVSVGSAVCEPVERCSLEQLLERADRDMYENKRRRQDAAALEAAERRRE